MIRRFEKSALIVSLDNQRTRLADNVSPGYTLAVARIRASNSSTNSGNYPDNVPNDSGTPADGSADIEIEVTPEMIEAGRKIIADYDEYYESDESIVRRVYEAMALSLRGPSGQQESKGKERTWP